MEERDDVVSCPTVSVVVATVEETLIADLGSRDRIEGSVAGGDEDGAEIMVEIVGSDVFVDGVRGEEDLNSGLGGSGQPKEDMGREIDAGNDAGGEIDNSRKGEDGEDGNSGCLSLGDRNETEVGGPHEIAEPLEQSSVDKNETECGGGLEKEVDAVNGDTGEIDDSKKGEDEDLVERSLDGRNAESGGPQETAEPLEQNPVDKNEIDEHGGLERQVDAVNGAIVGEIDDSEKKGEDVDLSGQASDDRNETVRGGPQEIAEPLEQSPVITEQSPVDTNETERGGLETVDAINGDVGEIDDLKKSEDGDLGAQVMDGSNETIRGGPQDIAEPLAQSPVVTGDTAVMKTEEGLERGEGSGGGGEDCTSFLSPQNTSILDDGAQNSGKETDAGDFVGCADSSREATLVAKEKTVVMVNDSTLQEINVLDDKVSSLGIKSIPECSSQVLESPAVETQVGSEEVVMLVVNEEELNIKDEMLGNKVVVTSLPCLKENQSSAMEKKENDEVNKNDDSSVQQTEDTVVGEASVVDRENILHSQPEDMDMETEVLDGNLCLVGKENQSSAVESVCTEKREDGEVNKNDDCLVQQTEDTVVGEAAMVDKEKILHSQTEERESEVFVGTENQSSAVEIVCTEKKEAGEVNKNDDCLVQQSEDTVIGEAAVVDTEKILHSQTEEMESEVLHGKSCLVRKENQTSAVESVCTEKRVDSEVNKKDDCLVQQPEDSVAGESAVVDKENILHSQTVEMESKFLDGKLENQSSAVERICTEKKEDAEVNKNDDCLVQRTEDAVVGEAAVVQKEQILQSQTEEMEYDVLDGKLCMVRGQETEIETDVKSVDKECELEAESVISSKPNDVCMVETGVAAGEVGVLCQESGSSTEIPEAAAGGSVATVVKSSIPDAESKEPGGRKVASPENRLVGVFNESLDCTEAEAMKTKAVCMDYGCDTAICAELESSTVRTEVVNGNEVTVTESKVTNFKLEVSTPVDVDGKLACSEVDQEVAKTIGSVGDDGIVLAHPKDSHEPACVAERTELAVADLHMTFSREDEVPEKMDLDGSYSGKDQCLAVETPEKVDGSLANDVAHAAIVESEDVLKSEFEILDGDTSAIAEKNIDDQTNVVSSTNHMESSVVHCIGTGEIALCNDCDGIISLSGKDEALKVETETETCVLVETEIMDTSKVTEKDIVEQPIVVSSIEQIESSPTHCLETVEIPARNEEVKLETDHGSMEEGAVGKDSSAQLDSLPVTDHSISVIKNNSDSLEECTSLKDEKQETVVRLSETPTHEVDGFQCTPSNPNESMNPGEDAVALSNAVTDMGDPVYSCVTDDISPCANQNLVDQTLGTFAPNVVTSHELVDQGIAAKDMPCNEDENDVMYNHNSDLKNAQLDNSVLLVDSLVVDLDDCIDKEMILKSQDEVVKENVSLPDESDGAREGCNEELLLSESLGGGDATGNQGEEQEVQVQEQITDAEQVNLCGGKETHSTEQAIETENPEAIHEQISEENTQTPRSSEKVHLASSFLALKDEGEFSVSDLVWGKVRSHPWWPGQIFDSADASERAVKHLKKDSFLVAYFGDRTFAWNEAHLLKPFWTHFSQVEKQSNSEVFHNAVSCALEELARRVELGMACSCIPKDIYDKIEYQTVENTGIRSESSKRHGMDKSMGVSSFQPTKLLNYIRTVAESPSGGVDRLELVIAEAQLLAISRLKGFRQLPEFEVCGGLLENDADASPLNEMDHANHVSEDGKLPGKGKSKTEISTSRKRKHNLKDSPYPWKKEKSLSELGDAASSPEGDGESDDKAMAKSVSSSTGKKRKAVESNSDGSVVQDRRTNVHAAKVSKTVSPIPKPSFKVGDCIRRVASQLTGSPSILKNCNEKSEKSQKVGGNGDKAARLDGSFNIESSSMHEMVSQLRSAAWDPLKGEYSFLSNIIPFFTAFRNTVVSRRQNASAGRKKKASDSMVGSPEEFEFDDVSDSYWTDMIVQNHEEDPLSTNFTEGGTNFTEGGTNHTEERGNHTEVRGNHTEGRGMEGIYQLVTFEPDKSVVKPTRRTYTRKPRISHGGPELVVEPTGISEERKRDSSPTELILNFNVGDHVPSEVNLNKIFRRFGPLKEAETEIDRMTSRARVIFKRCSDAEVAYNSAGKFNIFGPMLVSYQLSYTPSLGFGTYTPSLDSLLVEEDAT